VKVGRIVLLTVVVVFFRTWTYAADCNNGGRYENNGYPAVNGTVTDCRTGLIWLKDANCTDSLNVTGIDKSLGKLNWYDAIKWVAALGSGHCGLTDGSSAGDWRLPTKTELMAMVGHAKGRFANPALTNAAGTAKWTTNGDAFDNVQNSWYWSSTTPTAHEASDVYMVDGGMWNSEKTLLDYVWPVRAGQSVTFGSLTIE
jgi:hypothetical protein